MRYSLLLTAAMVALLTHAACAQNEALPAAPSPTHTPLVLPNTRVQSSAHADQVDDAEDLPCFSPSDGGGYRVKYRTPPTAHQSEAMKAYFWEMRKHIYDHWLVSQPRMAKRPFLKKGVVGVKFTVERDGTVDPPFVTTSSGREDFDHHAVESLQQMSPLAGLPGDTGPMHVCLFFYYNTSEPKVPVKKDSYDHWLDKPATPVP